MHVEFADREIEFLPTFHAFCLVVRVWPLVCLVTLMCVYLYNTSGLNSLMREWCVLSPLELCNCYATILIFDFWFTDKNYLIIIVCVCVCVLLSLFLG